MSMLKVKKGTFYVLHLRHSFLVSDSEDCVQVGIGILRVCLG